MIQKQRLGKPNEPLREWPVQYDLRLMGLLTFILVGTVAAFAYFDLQPYFEYQRSLSKIRKLVPLGTHVDDVPALLREGGFGAFYEGLTPDGDTEFSVLGATERRPKLLYVIQLRYYHWVVISVGADDRVKKIE